MVELPDAASGRRKVAPLFRGSSAQFDDANGPRPGKSAISPLSFRQIDFHSRQSSRFVAADICPELVVKDSSAEAAIPVMHIGLASACFMCNFFLPGSGKCKETT